MTGLDKAREIAQKLKQETELKQQDQETSLKTTMGELSSLKDLRRMANVGMTHVDKSDIRPPQVLLVQKSSNLEEMIDTNGVQPKFGQFFDTGARKIMDTFDCHVVFAKKGYYISRRNPERGEQEQYSMIGCMRETNRVFGMLLRSSARYALNNLFSTAIDQGYPMFAYQIHVEAKKLSNNDGEWVVPVFRIGQLEEDMGVLRTLSGIALKFDSQADTMNFEDDGEASTSPESSGDLEADEDVIPF